MPNEPYSVIGKVFDVDGYTPFLGATVILVNLRTKDSKQTTTEADGSYGFDISNFPSGYTVGDNLVFYARKDISDMIVKFATAKAKVAGTTLTQDLRLAIYRDMNVYPFSGLDEAEIRIREFNPNAMARRSVTVDREGNPVEYVEALSKTSVGLPEYHGRAKPGTAKSEAKWQIRKISYDSGNFNTDIQWAGGTSEFAHVWNDRASYDYG